MSNDNSAATSILSRIKANWAYIVVGAIGSALIFGGTVADNIHKLWEFVQPSPNALEIAHEASKAELSRDFVETNWKRLFRARNFLARLQRKAPAEDLRDAWANFNSIVEEAASKHMVYLLFFSQFYDDNRRSYFEGEISKQTNAVTLAIADLRYCDMVVRMMSTRDSDHSITDNELAALNRQIDKIKMQLDDLNRSLYFFSNCFVKELSKEEMCAFEPSPFN